MSRLYIAIVLSIFCFGCGQRAIDPPALTAKVAVKVGPPADPERALFEQVRSGTYQINAAMDSIEEARKTAKEMAARETGQTQHALLTIASNLDDAGGTLSDFADDPPPIEKFKSDFATQDDRRLKAIDGANDALDAVHDAQDLVEALLKSNPPEPEKTQLSEADSALDGCVEAVEDAIKTMGGKVATN